jgi:hypothetical protein
MSTDLQSPPEQNLTSLVSGIMSDAQDLFRQQAELFRHEVREDFRKTKDAAVPLAIGVWLVLLGSLLLSVTVALGLAAAGLPMWVSFAVVGVAVLGGGGGLYYVGKKKFESFNPLPDESATALKENLECLKPK